MTNPSSTHLRRNVAFPFLGFVLAGLLAGCAAGPDFKRPVASQVSRYTTGPLPGQTLSSPGILGNEQRLVSAQVPDEWWKEFRSTKLNGLIELAFQASPTLSSAQATLRQAEQNYAAQSRSTQLPQVNAKLGGQRQRTNGSAMGLPDGERTFDSYNASIVVGYDLDLAGGLRRGLEALAAQVDYQSFQLEGARLNLAASIALAAISQAQLTAQIEASKDILRAQQEQLEITRKRVAAGAASEYEILALQTQVEQTRAGIPAMRNRLEQTHHLLAVLAGQPPSAMDVPNFTLVDFSLPADLPLSVPSELVRRRPDIRASEALLHAATAQYGVAIAKLYPQLTLTANLGSQALTTASLFGPGSLIWSLGSQLTQPLFNPGLRSNARAAEAGLDAAGANYKQTVLQALRNVADILRTIESDAQAQASLVAASQSAEQSLRLVQQQLALGAASYLQILQAQQQAQQVRINVLAIQAQRLGNTVALYQAMGGGWEEPTTQDKDNHQISAQAHE
ncbi:MAG: efflux transporter outer membrane subunit [Holophagaceae bacterium]|nr:efflux transporter outer membrane subunit [Holophagaceae bacterium]